MARSPSPISSAISLRRRDDFELISTPYASILYSPRLAHWRTRPSFWPILASSLHEGSPVKSGFLGVKQELEDWLKKPSEVH